MSRPFRIAFLGYDSRFTRRFLSELVDDNRSIVYAYDNRVPCVTLTDGTLIVGVVSDRCLWDGIRYDQIIIADDRRMNILVDRYHTITALKHMRRCSDIPEEFGIQYFDVDSPRL